MSLVLVVTLLLAVSNDLDGQPLALEGTPRVSLGVLDQPEEEVFGSIVDLGLGPHDGVFILDGLAKELRWFSADGGFVGRAGREGNGPGEFASAFALDVDSSGAIHILDPQNQRITTFVAAEGEIRLARELSRIIGTDLCFVGAKRFVLTYGTMGDTGQIREVGDDGEIKRSFAPPESLELDRVGRVSGSVRDRLHSGLLACGDSAGVFLVSEIRPIVRAFDSSGELRWRTILDDYWGSRFEEGPRSGSVQRVPEGQSHYVHTAVAAAVFGDKLYITLHAGSLQDPEGSLELRILRAGDGTEIARRPTPVRVVAGREGRILGYAKNPYPRVFVY